MHAKWIYRRDGTKDYFLDGKQVSKRIFDRAVPSKVFAASGTVQQMGTIESYRRGRALESISVTPQKAGELQKFYDSRGIRARVCPDGTVVVHSKRAERAACESRGFYNRNGGYSDARQGAHPEYERRKEAPEEQQILDAFKGALPK